MNAMLKRTISLAAALFVAAAAFAAAFQGVWP